MKFFSTVINIDNNYDNNNNNTISILGCFLKGHVTLKTGVMMQNAENLVLITGINDIIKYLRIERSLNSKTYFTISLLLLYFGSNKCRLGEQKCIL